MAKKDVAAEVAAPEEKLVFTVLPTDELRKIRVADIKDNPNALRGVDEKSNKFIELMASVEKIWRDGKAINPDYDEGVYTPILVRECELVNGERFYMLINGLQRLTACRKLGIGTIAANVRGMDDAEALYAQLIANAQTIETKPREYAVHLQRILGENPTLTRAQLARDLSKGTQWIDNMLGLTDLDDGIGELVNEGKIILTNAYALAKLYKQVPEAIGDKEWVQAALMDNNNEFVSKVEKTIKDARDAKKSGLDPKPKQFELTPHRVKDSILLDAIQSPEFAKKLAEDSKVDSIAGAVILGMQYALQIDPISASIRAADYRAKREAAEALNKKKELERTEKKQQRELERAAKITADLEDKRAALAAEMAQVPS